MLSLARFPSSNRIFAGRLVLNAGSGTGGGGGDGEGVLARGNGGVMLRWFSVLTGSWLFSIVSSSFRTSFGSFCWFSALFLKYSS